MRKRLALAECVPTRGRQLVLMLIVFLSVSDSCTRASTHVSIPAPWRTWQNISHWPALTNDDLRSKLADSGRRTQMSSIREVDTECTLDRYTSALELCQVLARRQIHEGKPDTARASARTNGFSGAAQFHELLHPFWTSSMHHEQHAHAECKDIWYYRGRQRRACHVERTHSSDNASSSWCVVNEGTDGAHPGAWGAWKYCGDAHDSDLSPDSLADTWVLQPQSSFEVSDGPRFDALCERSGVCAAAIDALLDSCQVTNNSVMKQLVPLMDFPQCRLSPTRFASVPVRIEPHRCPEGFAMPETRQECFDAWRIGGRERIQNCKGLDSFAPKCFFRTDYDAAGSCCYNEHGVEESPWGNTMLLCGRVATSTNSSARSTVSHVNTSTTRARDSIRDLHVRLVVDNTMWNQATSEQPIEWVKELQHQANSTLIDHCCGGRIAFNSMLHFHHTNAFNDTIRIAESCEPVVVPQHCARYDQKCTQPPLLPAYLNDSEHCHTSKAACSECGYKIPTKWCRETVPDCSFTSGKPETCGHGCSYTSPQQVAYLRDVDSLQLSKEPATGHPDRLRGAHNIMTLVVMLLSLNYTEVHNVNVMRHRYRSDTSLTTDLNHTVVNFRMITSRRARPWINTNRMEIEPLLSALLNPVGNVSCISDDKYQNLGAEAQFYFDPVASMLPSEYDPGNLLDSDRSGDLVYSQPYFWHSTLLATAVFMFGVLPVLTIVGGLLKLESYRIEPVLTDDAKEISQSCQHAGSEADIRGTSCTTQHLQTQEQSEWLWNGAWESSSIQVPEDLHSVGQDDIQTLLQLQETDFALLPPYEAPHTDDDATQRYSWEPLEDESSRARQGQQLTGVCQNAACMDGVSGANGADSANDAKTLFAQQNAQRIDDDTSKAPTGLLDWEPRTTRDPSARADSGFNGSPAHMPSYPPFAINLRLDWVTPLKTAAKDEFGYAHETQDQRLAKECRKTKCADGVDAAGNAFAQQTAQSTDGGTTCSNAPSDLVGCTPRSTRDTTHGQPGLERDLHSGMGGPPDRRRQAFTYASQELSYGATSSDICDSDQPGIQNKGNLAISGVIGQLSNHHQHAQRQQCVAVVPKDSLSNNRALRSTASCGKVTSMADADGDRMITAQALPRRVNTCALVEPQLDSGSLASTYERRNGMFVCPWKGCVYQSSGLGHMKRHVRIHTGERPYVCSWPGCQYSASQSTHIFQHIRSHTGERPFKCTVEGCTYAASRSSHLRRHMRTVHDTHIGSSTDVGVRRNKKRTRTEDGNSEAQNL